MNPGQFIGALFLGIVIGGLAGSFIVRQQARAAIISGPYSDNFGPARYEIGQTITKLRTAAPSPPTSRLQAPPPK
jgi:hypothetical protein